MPMTPFMGVRISCDMFARKSLLVRLAASAASRASSIAASAFLRPVTSRMMPVKRMSSASRLSPRESSSGNSSPFLRSPANSTGPFPTTRDVPSAR
ncbi:MAG: hypothetical protein M3R38_16120 [Actinomycetota bacterium]|nr:hypothetical protein [Actinomycetota bacterium]